MCLSQVLKTFLTCKTDIYQKLKTEIQFLIWKLQALLIDSCCDTTEFQNKFQQSVQETMKNGLSILGEFFLGTEDVICRDKAFGMKIELFSY